MGRKELLYGLLQSLSFLAFANADSIGKSLDNCVSFDMKRIQEYISTLETPDFPSNFPHHQEEEMEENLQPFGVIKNDWIRLNLLRDSLPENSELRTKFDNIFRLLLIAHDRAKKFSHFSESEDFQDNVTTKTTLSQFVPETNLSKQEIVEIVEEIFETSPITVTEEFLSLKEPPEKTKENLKIISVNSTKGNITDETNDAITNASDFLLKNLANLTNLSIEKNNNEEMVENTSQRPNYSDEEKASSQQNSETTVENASQQSNKSDEEKTTSQPNGESILVESSTIFPGLSPILGLNGPIFPQFAKMPVSVSTTKSDDENASSFSHKDLISLPDELNSTAASILPLKNTDNESEILSNDFPSSKESILDDKMEKLKSISNFFEVSEVSDELQYLSTTPREKASTPTKMEDERTTATLSLIIKNPLEKTNFSESFSKEIDSANTILDTQNISSLPPSIPTNSIKQTTILEENSSSTIFSDSTTQKLSLMKTPNAEVLLLRKQEIDSTSSRQFSSSEENSSAELTDTRMERTTIPSQEILLSKEQEIDNKSWTQSSTLEEYSSTAKSTNSPNTERLTTFSNEEISLSEEQSIDNKSWTEFQSSEEYSSTTKLTDSSKSLTTTEEILLSENQEIYNSSWTKFPNPEEYSSSTELTNASTGEPILQNQEIQRTPWKQISESDEKVQLTTTIDYSSTENQSVKMTSIEEPLLIPQTLKERTEDDSTSSSKEDYTQSSLNADLVTELLKTEMEKSSTLSNEINITENEWTTINSNDELTTIIDSTVNSNEIKTSQDEEEHNSSNSQSLSQTFTSDSTIFTTERKFIDYTENPKSQEKMMTESSSTKYSTTSNQSEEEISTRVSFDEASKKMITEATEFSKEWQNTTEASREKLENENLQTNMQRNETENLEEDNEKSIMKSDKSVSSLDSGKRTKSNFVKNPLHNSASVNNHIFHDYKHASDNSALEDDDSESPRIILYESGVGAINRSVWRPQIVKKAPTGNWRFGNFNKNVESNGNEEASRSGQTNIDIPKKSMSNSEWPFSARKNTLRSRKRGSANADIEKQFRWFYRQAGQSSDHVGSRDNEKDDAQINVRC